MEKKIDEIKIKKQQIRENISKKFRMITKTYLKNITKKLENQLFEFANFLESKIVLLYINSIGEVPTKDIIKKTQEYRKIVVLPSCNKNHSKITLMKVDNIDLDLKKGPKGILQPNKSLCREVPVECIDIAIIPGIAMDEKGGRLGYGEEYYDKLIPKLPITTRKIGLIFEDQLVSSIPMESHNKHVDIIITEKRIIYKI